MQAAPAVHAHQHRDTLSWITYCRHKYALHYSATAMDAIHILSGCTILTHHRLSRVDVTNNGQRGSDGKALT